MNEKTLEKIRAELASRLTGQRFGKIFTLARFRLAVDFRLPESEYLFIGFEPSAPRVYLIKRRLKDLEKQTGNPSPFVLFARKRLANSILQAVEKIKNERVLRFNFDARNELGERENYALVVQLTGRSANLFLLDARDFILDRARETNGDGQQIAQVYAPPFSDETTRRRGDEEIFPTGEYETLSESLDAHFLEAEAENVFSQKARAAQSKLKV